MPVAYRQKALWLTPLASPSVSPVIGATCRSSAIGDPGAYVVTAAATLAFLGDGSLKP